MRPISRARRQVDPREVTRAIPLLAQLSTPALTQLLEVARMQQRPAGAPVITRGEPASGAFLVVRGALRGIVEGPGAPQDDLRGPGDVLGEIALLTGAPYSATVVATEPSTLLHVPQAAFAALRDQRAPAATELLRLLSPLVARRMRQTATRIDALFRPDEGGISPIERAFLARDPRSRA